MVIRETDAELEICGSPAELNAIADQIEQLGAGEELRAPADADADPRPYDRCLAGLTVRATNGPVRVSVTDDHVIATASPSAVQIFASFFRFEENSPPGTHGHHEWFAGNESIAPDSRPLVISVG
jgi:hypothetical protein